MKKWPSAREPEVKSGMQNPPNRNETPKAIDHVGGIAAALVYGLVGFCAPIVVVLTFTVFRWFLENASEFDRDADLRRLPGQLIFMVVGTAFIFSAAGFATYAPRGRFRFTWTLLRIFILTATSWFLLAATGVMRPRYKSADHPLIYVSEFLILSLPPILIGVGMAILRGRGSTLTSTTPERPPATSQENSDPH
jgi:hypothetical protein